MLRRVRLALVLVLVLALPACGRSGQAGSAKAAYEHRMATLVPPLQGEVLKRRLALEQVRVPTVAHRQLRRLEQELRTAIAGLKRIAPPKDVAAEHASLIAGYASLLKDFTALDSDAARATTDKLRVGAGRLAQAPAIREIGGSLQAIIAKGYDLGFPKES
jgi:hypothetical protein